MNTLLLGLVIPTRNNPKKLESTLAGLATQQAGNLRIVVVSSGESVSQTIALFESHLKIDHVHSDRPGQIYQRNIGIAKLQREGARYIGFWDDDVVPLPNCLLSITKFIEEKTAEGLVDFGVGLNITNELALNDAPFSNLQRLLGRVGSRPGQVTVTGMNSSIAQLSSNINTEWLGGGYTIWSANILKLYPQKPMNTLHAAGEDLIYSYPTGKVFPLFVCADAKVIHNSDRRETWETAKFREERATVARLYFCSQHEELSTTLYTLSEITYRLIFLLIPGRFAIPKLLGFVRGLKRHYFGKIKGGDPLHD